MEDNERAEGEPEEKITRKRPGGLAGARRRIARGAPSVANAIVTHAKKGSAAHARLFLETSGLLRGGLGRAARKKAQKSLEAILMEQWERDRIAREPSQNEESRNEEGRNEQPKGGNCGV